MPSASSIRSPSADPSTPASAAWEPATLNVATALPGSQHLQEPSSSQGEDEVGQFTIQEKQKWPERGDSDVGMDEENGGDGQESQPHVATAPPACALAGVSASAPSSSVKDRPHSLPACPRQSKLSKADAIRLAQERRQELIEELERVKTRLWETTIEQGVLVELQKQLLP